MENHRSSVDYFGRPRKAKEVVVGQTPEADFDFQIRKATCTFSVSSSLRSYELPHHVGKSSGCHQGLRSNQDFMHRMVMAHAPGISSCLREGSFDNKVISEFNKAFSSAWLDHRTVVVGTKCNRLLRVNVETLDLEDIPLPKCGGQEGQASSIDADCGIRSISINSSNTLLATSGARPSDLAIFEIPSFKPVIKAFSGHTDWIFGTAFVDETHVITASRDESLRVWDVTEGRRRSEEGCIYSGHKSRVRDVKYDSSCSLAASVSADGILHLWDPSNLALVREVELAEGKSQEITCAAMDNGLVAVGSQCHISLVDVRCSNSNTKYVTSKEPELGIRSVSFHQGQGLLTIGGSGGKISFFDLRKDDFVVIPSRASQTDKEDQKEGFHLQSSQGFWNPGDLQVFSDFNLSPSLFLPSCYTHSWDPSGTRLFTGGGPTFLLARGCYMSLWS